MKKALAIFVVLVFFTAPLFPQNVTNVVPDKAVQEIDYKPIAVIEIPQKIEEVYSFLKKVNSIEIPATEIDKLEENFKKFQKDITTLKKETSPKNIKNVTTKKLKDYKQKWKVNLASISTFKNVLEESSKRLDKERIAIEKILTFWEETYTNAKKEKAPKDLLKRLVQLKGEVKKTDKNLFKILTRVLSIRDKVSIEEVNIKEIIASIDKLLEEHKSLLFTIDSPPIWVSLADTTEAESFAENISKSVKRFGNAFEEFWDMYSEIVPYYFAFFILVLLVVFYLKHFTAKNISQSIVDKNPFAIKILNKPFSIAVLIVVYFILPFFPLAPTLVLEVARISLIIPILFLFPTFISKVFQNQLYFISILYIFQQIVELFVGQSIHLRIFIIFLTLLMLAAFVWFLKVDFDNLPAKRIKLVYNLRIIIRILFAVLFISLFGNIIGNTALSTLIFYGVMRTIYYSLILITSLQVIYTLITIVLETKLASYSMIIKNRSDEVKKVLFSFVKFLGLLFWIKRTLMNFEIYESTYKSISNFLITPIVIGDLSFEVGNIFLFIISIWISLKLSKMIRYVFDNEVFPRVVLPRGVPAAISVMMNYTILTLGFLISLSFVGFNIEKLTIVIGALGVGIGFGLQNIVNNFLSGLILLFERPIQVGDTISILNLSGTVKRIGIRASVVRTFDGAEVIVPNADLISGQVTNWTLSDSRRRIEIKIGVHFKAKPEVVMNILTSSLETEEDVLKTPAPYILYRGMNKSTQDFVLRFWTANSDDWIFIRSNILLNITKSLNDAGIEIPYKQQNVYLKNSVDENSGNETK